MKLDRIHLQNFRCFEHLLVSFHPKLTVIVAENGTGKTAILDAIATGFGRLFTKLPKVGGIAPRETDIRIEQGEDQAPFMSVLFEATTQQRQQLRWTIHKKRDNTAKTARAIAASLSPEIARIGQKQIDDYAARLPEAIDDYSTNLMNAEGSGEAYFLPVIAYYGTNRAILDEVQRRRNYKKQFSRFDALSGALEANARFKGAFEWFNAMEDVERRAQQERRDFNYRLSELNTVRSAIVNTLPVGFSNPRTEIRPLRFVIDRMMPDGVTRTFRLGQLSDGFRVMLGLVMDLARRMAQANSLFAPNGNQIMNPLDLPAIVLIDEVDLHLHPKWQQTVLADLTRTFKGTQFIVTTHSPQVLSTVKREHIRILKQSETGFEAVTPDFSPLAHEAGDALAKVMGTHKQPPLPILETVREFEQTVRAGEENSGTAKALQKILDDAGYQIHESDLVTWRFLARRHAAKGA